MSLPQAPGFQATSQQTPRVLTRGKLEFFVFSFFYDDAQTLPVTPYDSSTHPNFRILAPGGEMLAQGVAVPAGSPGNWKVGWVVPRNTTLTTVNQRYRFQTVMVDANMRQFEVSFEFDVVESAIPAQKPELQQLVTFKGEGIRISFVNTVRPDMLKVKITPRGQDGTIIYAAAWTPPPPIPPPVPPPNTLQETIVDNAYVYYVDVPAFGNEGDYSALWSVRDTTVSATDFEHQAVVVITPSIMYLVKSLRQYIDRLQKKLGIVFAYPDEDLIEYVKQGAALVNAYTPPTTFTASTMPSQLEAFAVLAAAWWALGAQRILYAETNFSFSGQTVTLDYNPGADIDSIMSSMKDTLDNQMKATKKNLFRQAAGVGSIATRPYNFRHNLVFKTSVGVGADIVARLAEFGLLD